MGRAICTITARDALTTSWKASGHLDRRRRPRDLLGKQCDNERDRALVWKTREGSKGASAWPMPFVRFKLTLTQPYPLSAMHGSEAPSVLCFGAHPQRHMLVAALTDPATVGYPSSPATGRTR